MKRENIKDLEDLTEYLKQTAIKTNAEEARQHLQDQFIKKLCERKIPVSYARGRMISEPGQIDKFLNDAEQAYIADSAKK